MLGGAVFQFAIFSSIIYSFQMCYKSGLNIGIAQAIWAINPFFVALLEWYFLATSLHRHHILGMLAMMVCIVSVMLSDVVTPDTSTITEDESITEPVWKAVLYSTLPPIAITMFTLYIKFVKIKARLQSYDFTIGLWGLLALVFQLVGIVYFTTSSGEETFDFDLWLMGTIASLCNTMGSTFAIACLSTGAPMGPSSALFNS